MRLLIILACLQLLMACGEKKETPVTIGINPWPGYEYLYLAQQLGYFKQLGLNVSMHPLDSLSDTQRAYIHGRVDGFTSTLIEVVQAQVLSDRPLNFFIVTDYSNGGDVILARKSIETLADIKGKRVGCEVSSLGIYLLHRALATVNLSLEDVNVVNLEQSLGKAAFENDEIDVFVTYPPISLDILKFDDIHTVFTSAEIPYEILDVVSLSVDTIKKDDQLVPGIRKAWQMALDYERQHPLEAHQIMAARQRISVEEYTSVLGDIKILDDTEQTKLFQQAQFLQQRSREVCETLVAVQAIETDCAKLPSVVYQ